MTLLRIDGLTKTFQVNGSCTTVLEDLSLSVQRGEFLCVLGRSGCGKSTLLNLVAGFIPPSVGQILVEECPIDRPGPDRCLVFQEDALFPWLTVGENIAFGLRGRGIDTKDRHRQVDRFLDMTGPAAAGFWMWG